MLISRNQFDAVQFPRLHDSLVCISKWDNTKSIHSVYIDPNRGAALTFNGILPEDAIRMVLAEFINKNWGVEDIDSIEVSYGSTHTFNYESNTTQVFTPDGVDVRR